MAIYHLNAKVISRSSGKSSVAAAAYRSASKLKDFRQGVTYSYVQKTGVFSTEILAPSDAPDWVYQREQLWNQVEFRETRKNSQLARELDVAFPQELTSSQQISLARSFVLDFLVARGVVADLAFHDLNGHNPHFHVMFTTRFIDSTGWTDKDRASHRKEFLLDLRQGWGDYTNQALAEAGFSQRVDPRSYLEQGIPRVPQVHLGPQVVKMTRKGIETERQELYNQITEKNRQSDQLFRQIKEKETVAALLDWTDEVKPLITSLENSSTTSPRQPSTASSLPPVTPTPTLPPLSSGKQRRRVSVRWVDVINAFSDLQVAHQVDPVMVEVLTTEHGLMIVETIRIVSYHLGRLLELIHPQTFLAEPQWQVDYFAHEGRLRFFSGEKRLLFEVMIELRADGSIYPHFLEFDFPEGDRCQLLSLLEQFEPIASNVSSSSSPSFATRKSPPTPLPNRIEVLNAHYRQKAGEEISPSLRDFLKKDRTQAFIKHFIQDANYFHELIRQGNIKTSRWHFSYSEDDKTIRVTDLSGKTLFEVNISSKIPQISQYSLSPEDRETLKKCVAYFRNKEAQRGKSPQNDSFLSL